MRAGRFYFTGFLAIRCVSPAAPPSEQKIPETVSEMLPAAESKAIFGEYDEAISLYDKIITLSPEPLILASAYWGRGATRMKHFTGINTRVRTLRLKIQSDKSFTDEYQTTQKEAQTLLNQGVEDHLKAAKVAQESGLKACSQEIREILPQLPGGMVRYNNPYDVYLKRTLPRC
ncbi:hypothetical protein PCC7424_3881 [Gloeothece citriformis PCC 7424]|uniref:TPR repeat-containing protein n=1 Tax=Gloeothece citriformis (strain PCC 7424) TaxID=65393 RepID=B7KKC7_GLOC7|nr:hypothetical protein [Gloeothece citriformis]ACK72260.1 hypothetical protein PCC7424_3881 [Gloeothece citriformis PCC 7424]